MMQCKVNCSWLFCLAFLIPFCLEANDEYCLILPVPSNNWLADHNIWYFEKNTETLPSFIEDSFTKIRTESHDSSWVRVAVEKVPAIFTVNVQEKGHFHIFFVDEQILEINKHDGVVDCLKEMPDIPFTIQVIQSRTTLGNDHGRQNVNINQFSEYVRNSTEDAGLRGIIMPYPVPTGFLGLKNRDEWQSHVIEKFEYAGLAICPSFEKPAIKVETLTATVAKNAEPFKAITTDPLKEAVDDDTATKKQDQELKVVVKTDNAGVNQESKNALQRKGKKKGKHKSKSTEKLTQKKAPEENQEVNAEHEQVQKIPDDAEDVESLLLVKRLYEEELYAVKHHTTTGVADDTDTGGEWITPKRRNRRQTIKALVKNKKPGSVNRDKLPGFSAQDRTLYQLVGSSPGNEFAADSGTGTTQKSSGAKSKVMDRGRTQGVMKGRSKSPESTLGSGQASGSSSFSPAPGCQHHSYTARSSGARRVEGLYQAQLPQKEALKLISDHKEFERLKRAATGGSVEASVSSTPAWGYRH